MGAAGKLSRVANSEYSLVAYALCGIGSPSPSPENVRVCAAVRKICECERSDKFIGAEYLTFSTHPKMPGKAAPGQIVAEEVRRLKVELGLLPSGLEFFLFGSPIAKSASPAMHNAAFEACGLDWTYGRCETEDVSACISGSCLFLCRGEGRRDGARKKRWCTSL